MGLMHLLELASKPAFTEFTSTDFSENSQVPVFFVGTGRGLAIAAIKADRPQSGSLGFMYCSRARDFPCVLYERNKGTRRR